MPEQKKRCHCAAAAHTPLDQAAEGCARPVWRDLPCTARNRCHAAQQFGFEQRWIVSRERIATRQQLNAFRLVRFTHYTVGIEATSTGVEDHITALHLVRALATDRQHIARKYAGNHASTPNTELEFAKQSENLRCKIQLDRMP